MILTVCFTDDEDKVSNTDDTKPESEQEVPSTSHTVTKPVATTTTPTVGLFGEQTWLLKYRTRVFVQNCRPKNSIVIHDSCDQKHLNLKMEVPAKGNGVTA